MPATVTLSTTTLYAPVLDASSTQIAVVSASGMVIGTRLWIDKELLRVIGFGTATTPFSYVNVIRGDSGSAGAPHSSGSLVTFGSADQFYGQDPVGMPAAAVLVSPYINVRGGTVWLAQGDSEPTGLTQRWWQNVTTTYGIGPLGIRTTTQDPTVST